MIRPIVPNDFPAVAQMAKRFSDLGPQGFNEEEFLEAPQNAVDLGGAFRSEKGFIFGALAPAYCNRNWLIAIELAWWAEDGKGLSLLAAFEGWARDCGAKEVRMTTLHVNPGPEKILARRGYERAEISHRKVI